MFSRVRVSWLVTVSRREWFARGDERGSWQRNHAFREVGHPRYGKLRWGNATLSRDFLQPLDDCEVVSDVVRRETLEVSTDISFLKRWDSARQ